MVMLLLPGSRCFLDAWHDYVKDEATNIKSLFFELIRQSGVVVCRMDSTLDRREGPFFQVDLPMLSFVSCRISSHHLVGADPKYFLEHELDFHH